MDANAEIREALADFVRTLVPDGSLLAVVKSVDKTAGTIVATGQKEEVDYFDVRLRAALVGANGVGVVALPVVGSTVVITLLDGIDTMAYVSQYSDVDAFALTLSNGIKVELTAAGELHLNGDALGGIVKVANLVQRMNAAESAINVLNVLMGTHVHPVLTPAAVPFLAAPITGPFPAPPPPLQLTTRLELENPVVKHG